MARRPIQDELNELLTAAEVLTLQGREDVPPGAYGATRRRARAASIAARLADELYVLWSAARAEANLAYDAWCRAPGRAGYAVYRACEDRADAAERALAAARAAHGAPLPLALLAA